jgi:hypothetical protein
LVIHFVVLGLPQPAGSKRPFALRNKTTGEPLRRPDGSIIVKADDYLPQKAMRDKAKLLHDCSRLYLWGRQRGVGGTLVTQRSARIHKDVLTQSASLIVFRTTAPQDQKAILDWVKYHGQSEEVMESLSGLESGEGWIWSPEWLRVMKRIQFRRRETFDSGATPTGASRNRSPATLADVDLGAIKDKMASTIEKAKAEDPRELRKKIAELERELRSRSVIEVKVEKEIERIEVPVLKNGQLDKTLNLIGKLEGLSNQVREIAGNLSTAIGRATKQAAPRPAPSRPVPDRRPATRVQEAPHTTEIQGPLPRGEAKILAALIQYPNGLRRNQLTVLTGYKRSSRDAYVQRLREKGYLDQSGETVIATDQGRTALPDAEPLPTGVDLQTYWLQRLPFGERVLFENILGQYPESVDREALTEMTNYKRSSRDAYIQRLIAKELVEDQGRGQVRASEELFQ